MRPRKVYHTNPYKDFNVDDKQYSFSFGNFLRRYKLDELPNIVNMINGNLSLIGPRSLWTKLVVILSKRIEFYSARGFVVGGITGWAQVKYISAQTLEQDHIRFLYDLYYIKNASLFLDLQIIFLTIKRVFINDKDIH